MTLNGLEETRSILDRDFLVTINEGFNVTLDDAEGGSQFVGYVGDEFFPDEFELLLLGDVVKDEKDPRPLGKIEWRDGRVT